MTRLAALLALALAYVLVAIGEAMAWLLSGPVWGCGWLSSAGYRLQAWARRRLRRRSGTGFG